MSRLYFALILVLLGLSLQAQPETDVYVFDVSLTKDSLLLSNIKNISNLKGYDNQPSFLDEDHVLFASTRSGQTDICSYNLKNNSKIWLTDTEGSEYSPLKIPSQEAFSAVLLEKNGTQRLLAYPLVKDERPNVLIDDIVIGYHLWLNRNIIISSIIKDENLTLTVSDFKLKKHKDLIDNVGRSLLKIPSKAEDRIFSFVDKNSTPWLLMSFDLDRLKAKLLFEMLPNVEDLIWLNDDLVLAGSGNKLYSHNNRKRSDWIPMASLENYGLTNITRLALSPNGKKLALVAEKILDFDERMPQMLVQQQLDAYNSKNLEAFLANYSEDIKLYNFPNTLISEGKTAMRDSYSSMFASIDDLYAEIENRSIIGNKVIDKEKVTVNGKTIYTVAIYEIENGLIKSVTFMQ